MLKIRILTAVGLLAVFLPALFYLPTIAWACLMGIIALLGLKEWLTLSKLTNQQSTIVLLISFVLGSLVVFSITSNQNSHTFFKLCLALSALSTLFWVLSCPRLLYFKPQLPRWVLALLGVLLIVALWLAIVALRMIDPAWVLIFMAVIWVADSAAYFAGKNFGKHKLAPSISPGKTCEGVMGALIGVSFLAIIVQPQLGFELWVVLVLFWLLCILGVLGDLFESLLKRQTGVKDSGNLLPGHGGVLDRIDGLIPALPAAIALIYLARQLGWIQ